MGEEDVYVDLATYKLLMVVVLVVVVSSSAT